MKSAATDGGDSEDDLQKVELIVAEMELGDEETGEGEKQITSR